MEPGVHPYVGHLWGLMSGEQTSARDGGLVVHSGPWRARLREFKRIRILYDTFTPHVALRSLHNDLHLAAGDGDLALVAELLDQGADVDARDRLGHTALHYAAHRVHVHVMLLLLDRGAAIDAVPAVNYLTPLACVVWRRHRAAARLLLALGAIVAGPYIAKVTVFYAAASVGDVETAEVMIRLGVHVDSVDDMGKTALHRAAGGNHFKMVEALLRYGANVNTRSWRGNTPLSLASKGGYVEVMKMLLAAGADPDIGQPSFPKVMHEM
ncbi:ankyrin [Peniophora sp. CONT]|nr:ankyrin [Peniophora sp. CONT]